MKKFEFTLQKMLSYKEQLLEKEKNALMQLRSEKNQITEHIALLEAQFDQINKELLEKTRESVDAEKIKGHRFQLDNTRHQLRQLRIELQQVEAAIERQLRVVVSITQEVEGMEKLREKQQEEYNYNLAKSEELMVAELVNTQRVLRQIAL